MGASHSPAFLADGAIAPSRFVTITADFSVAQVDAITDRIFGVSQEGTRDAPGLSGASANAASDNETLRVYGPGEVCLLELGDTVTAGQWLKANTDGKGVPATFSESANTPIGAIALQGGASGNLVRVFVHLSNVRPA